MKSISDLYGDMLFNPKKRRVFNIFLISLTLLLIIIMVFVNPILHYLEIHSYSTESNIHYYSTSEQYGILVKNKQVYYTGENFCRFYYLEGTNYYTLFVSDGKAYLCFDNVLKECWELEPGLIDAETLKAYIDDKAKHIRADYEDGIDNIWLAFNFSKDFVYEADVISENEKVYYIKGESRSSEVNIESHPDGKKNLDYSEGKYHWFLSTQVLGTKPQEVIGTVSTVDEFNKMMEEHETQTTFEKMFGK